MGCDIHLYFEHKIDGEWKRIFIPEDLLPDERDYDLFYFLAGVRSRYPKSETTPQFEGRGIPSDSSLPAGAKLYGDEGIWIGDHSFTHAYLDEILNAPWKEAELDSCYFYIFCSHVLTRPIPFFNVYDDLQKRNVRVIMGFDN